VNQEEVVIGAFTSGPHTSTNRKIIGPFQRKMALKVRLSEPQRLCEVMQNVEELLRQASRNCDVALEEVLRRLEPARAINTDLTAWIEYEDARTTAIAEESFVDMAVSKFACVHAGMYPEVLLSLRDESGGLVSSVEYDGRLFDRRTIEQLIACWEVVLSEIASGISRGLGEIRLVSESGR